MSVVWKKAYSNVPRPQMLAFKFTTADTDETTTDGYTTSPGGFTVSRGDADGYYSVTAPRKFGAADVIYADAKVYDATYPDATKTAQVISQNIADGVFEVVTRGAAGTVQPLTDVVVEVFLLIQGINAD